MKSWLKKSIGVVKAHVRCRTPPRWRHFGFRHFCPCCRAWLRRFASHWSNPKFKVVCPICGSLQRDRLIWLYLLTKTDLFDGRRKNLLHIAPEPQLSRLLRHADYLNYLSADLVNPRAMVQMDLTNIQYADNVFDVIFCSHVLEHVPDDRKAMRELFRVLKPEGWAILHVPITAALTFEDPAVVSPEERERVFGQHDHVRQYGRDYAGRLADAGFSVIVDGFVRGFGRLRVDRLGLAWDEDVHFCKKK